MEIDWKEELLASQSFNKKEEKLLNILEWKIY